MITTTLPETAAPSIADQRQPSALWNLFLTEMWERFSYYGMRALLVLYLTKALGYTRGDALAVYAVFTGLVYLTPMVGGYIADRLLGFRKAILTGGLNPNLYAAGLTLVILLAIGMAALFIRALVTGEFYGALFLLTFAALFGCGKTAAMIRAALAGDFLK